MNTLKVDITHHVFKHDTRPTCRYKEFPTGGHILKTGRSVQRKTVSQIKAHCG